MTEGEDEIKTKIGAMAALWGGLDVLVNNAGARSVFRSLGEVQTTGCSGYGLPGLIEEGGCVIYANCTSILATKDNVMSRTKLLRRQFETNVFGLLDVTTAALPYLRKSQEACVVVVGSRSAWTAEIVVRPRLTRAISVNSYFCIYTGTWPLCRLESCGSR